jgi:hypothetical protein
MARYSRNTYSVSIAKSITGNADGASNVGSADSDGNIAITSGLYHTHCFTEPNRFAIESLCFAQECRASRDSQADGEGRGSERGLKAD